MSLAPLFLTSGSSLPCAQRLPRRGGATVTQQAKPPLQMSTPHIGVKLKSWLLHIREAADDGWAAWIPATLVGDPDGVPDLSLWPGLGPAPAVVATGGVNQWI